MFKGKKIKFSALTLKKEKRKKRANTKCNRHQLEQDIIAPPVTLHLF